MTAQDDFINIVAEKEEMFVDFDVELVSTFNKVGRK